MEHQGGNVLKKRKGKGTHDKEGEQGIEEGIEKKNISSKIQFLVMRMTQKIKKKRKDETRTLFFPLSLIFKNII